MTTDTRLRALALADATAWFKSSYSGDNGGGGCVSVARLPRHIAVRDSKQDDGPAFLMPASAWAAFVGQLRSGDL